MTTAIPTTGVPRLGRGVKFRYDRARERHVLLLPETVVVLNATGTATWGSLTKSDNTRIVDFSVGTSGADLNLNTTSIVAGAQVSVSSFVITGGNA